MSAFGLTDRPLLLPSPPTFWTLSRSPITLKPLPQQTILWAFSDAQITLKNECKDSMRSQLTTKLSGGDSLDLQHQRFASVRSNDLLAERRTDRPPTTPHPQPPGRFHNHRSPLTTALTDNLLSAFAITDKLQTTASTDHFLGVFGFTDHLEKRV